MALLKVDDIHVYYGSIHAVKGVSFQVNEGEIVTLIGANGAGKSTVLNTVSGLLHPRGGSVSFMDQDLKGVAPHKVVERGLAQVPEGRRIFLQMTVEENLEMGAYTQPNSAVEPGIADVYQRFPRLRRHHHSSGGAERPGRPLCGGPGLRAGDGPHLPQRHRRGTDGQRQGAGGVPGRLRNPYIFAGYGESSPCVTS